MFSFFQNLRGKPDAPPPKSLRSWSSALEVFGKSKDPIVQNELKRAIMVAEAGVSGLISRVLRDYLCYHIYEVEPVKALGGLVKVNMNVAVPKAVLVPKVQSSWYKQVDIVPGNTNGPLFSFGVIDMLEHVVCVWNEGIDRSARDQLPGLLAMLLRDIENKESTVDNSSGSGTESESEELGVKSNKSPRSSQLSRQSMLLHRLVALLCSMLPHEAVQRSLVGEGLNAVMDMVLDDHRNSLAMLSALSSQKIYIAEPLIASGFLIKLIGTIQTHMENKEMENVAMMFRTFVRFMKSSARTNQLLLDEFKRCNGYRFVLHLVSNFQTSPLLLDDVLSDLRDLVFIGPGLELAEKSMEQVGNAHVLYLARNTPAFAVHCILLFRLELKMVVEGSAAHSRIEEYLSNAMDCIQGEECILQQLEEDIEGESFLLSLLDSVLTIYSSNPVNFGLLDEQFNLMSGLLASLGALIVIPDDVVFVILKVRCLFCPSSRVLIFCSC